jgi:hypothetical protein
MLFIDSENNYRKEIVDNIIFNKLENQEWVSIIVDCNNREAILSKLDDTNFKMRYTFSDGDFSGVVTRVGLNIIKRDPNVKKVFYNYPVHAS